MHRCPTCAAEVPAASRFCLSCGAALDASAIPTVAMAERSPRSSSSTSDEGRFPAGTVLGERYRIVGLLGRGGMGEVYRAHDLKLEQQVALKFLPLATARDSHLLERFRGEVRIARQVSHRNVCRVYDLGEINGAPYISMEYIDGEDLGSLLRRIGRLPGDKAIEFARRLCAGLAAAHEKGVLHRDLKPANVMIDGRGQVLIMDFGLAAVADAVAGGDIRSGTPAYMAPEQKEGREVTVRSDIYSLGLVLSEMFTGQKASGDGKLSDTLSKAVKDIDPAVERVIQRCLDPNPSRRPASALDVARGLPGGDPLAEALAAGDTPSPEMVAASEDTGALSVRAAVICLVAVVAGLIGVASLKPYILPPLPDPPELLARKAHDLAVRFGYTNPPADSAYGFQSPPLFQRWAEQHEKSEEIRSQLAAGQPAVLGLWYRQSAGPLLPFNLDGTVLTTDPPPIVPDMIAVTVDTQGRLLEFHAVAPAFDDAAPPAHSMNWSMVLEAAGFDPSLWKPAQPERAHPVSFDERAAWTGSYSNAPSIPIRIEAASWRGRLVSFSTYGPWSPRSSAPAKTSHTRQCSAVVVLGGILAVMASGAFLAWRNYQRQRGDPKGAWRLALFIFATGMVWWILSTHYVPDPLQEIGLFFFAFYSPLYAAAAVWILYMALEPYVRRRWPQSLISWTRLLNGAFRDPMVAGHALAGLALGVLLEVVLRAGLMIYAQGSGLEEFPFVGGAQQTLALWVILLQAGIEVSCGFLLLVFLLRAMLRRTWLFSVAVAVVACLPLILNLATSNVEGIHGPPLANAIVNSLFFACGFLTLFRLGLLASLVMVIANMTAGRFITFDFSAWYATPGIVALAAILAAAVWTFRNSLGGRTLWKGDFLGGLSLAYTEPMGAAKTLLSAEEFDNYPFEEDKRYELDEGELIEMTRPAFWHNQVLQNLLVALVLYFRQNPIGLALLSENLYALSPSTRRAPDVAVILGDRRKELRTAKVIHIVPDIVAEVLSPNETTAKILRKLKQYFDAGVKEAWLIYPETDEVEIWTGPNLADRALTVSDPLTSKLLPDFALPLADLFS